jgi:hypothetical protein
MTGTMTMTSRTESSDVGSASLRTRLGGLDPITPLVGLVALVVYLLHGFGGQLNRDLGVYAYAGQQFADGVPPYEGILNRAGPLAHALPGVGMWVGRIFGADDVRSARVFFMLFAVAAVSMTYLVGRDLFRSRWAGLASSASMLSFLGFVEYATNGPREKTPMVFFLLVSYWMVTRNRYFAAGVFIGLAALTWQPSFLVGVTVAGVAALMRPERRLRSLVDMVVGGAISALVCSVYFLVMGAWDVFYEGFFEINARYSGAVSFLHRPGYVWDALRDGYGASLWLFLAGLVTLLVAAVAAVALPTRRKQPEVRVVAAFGAAMLVGFAWTWHDINGWPDLFVLLPSAALGIGAVFAELAARVPARVVLVVATAWAVVAAIYAGTYAVTQRSHDLAEQRASVDAVLGSMPSDATLLSVETPQVMVLADRTNPTRLIMFPASLRQYMEDSYPGGVAGFTQWLADDNPTIMAVHGEDSWLTPVLEKDYKRVGTGMGWGWYMARSAGQDAIAKVVAALRETRS